GEAMRGRPGPGMGSAPGLGGWAGPVRSGRRRARRSIRSKDPSEKTAAHLTRILRVVAAEGDGGPPGRGETPLDPAAASAHNCGLGVALAPGAVGAPGGAGVADVQPPRLSPRPPVPRPPRPPPAPLP